MGRLDVVSMAIHALLTDLPRALYENASPAVLVVDGGVIISNKGAQGSSKIISEVALVKEDSGGINGNGQPVTSGDGRANKIGVSDGTEASPTGKSEKTGVDGLRFRDLEKIQEARKVMGKGRIELQPRVVYAYTMNNELVTLREQSGLDAV